MYSIRDLLLHLKNCQTKFKYFHYLKQRNALDASVGFVYKRGALEMVYIY